MSTELLPYVLLGYGSALIDATIIAGIVAYIIRRRNPRGAAIAAAPVPA